jgi:hypothetical protein
MDTIKNMLMTNPLMAGAAAGAITYFALDFFRPPPIYKEDKSTLQYELLSPLALAGAAAVAAGFYVNTHRPSFASSLLGAASWGN